jgi:hypothetical protein
LAIALGWCVGIGFFSRIVVAGFSLISGVSDIPLL